jgi:glycosyltransferase involved in cell wall biosynthesis
LKNITVYILLPKKISFSVLEATFMHADIFKSAGAKIVFLSRKKAIERPDTVVYFNNQFGYVNYLKDKENGIVYSITVLEFLIAYIVRLRNRKLKLFSWFQGLIDEEDYLTRENKLRRFVFNCLMKLSVKKADKIVVVTNKMFQKLVDDYGCPRNKEYLKINCKSRVGYNFSRKIRNSICYLGGLSKWQNVDVCLRLFNQICERDKTYNFYLATYNWDHAKSLISKYIDEEFRDRIELIKVQNTSEVERFLSKMEFGLLIRDDIVINHVASPIKLAEYLSCGVNPIFSSSLLEFKNEILDNKAGLLFNEDLDRTTQDLLTYQHSTENAIKVYKMIYENDGSDEAVKHFLYL